MDLRDRILGCIIGHALGDAIGNSAGVWPPPEPAADATPKYERGDWTEETDTMILVMRALMAGTPPHTADPLDVFAKSLTDWAKDGLPELGDTGCAGLNPIVAAVLKNPEFAKNPQAVAEAHWRAKSATSIPNNGSLTRTTPVGCIADVKSIGTLAADFSTITHFDPREVAACVLHSSLIHELIYGTPELTLEKSVERVKRVCSVCEIDFDKDVSEDMSACCKIGMTGLVPDLGLAEWHNLSHVFAALSCSVYALQLILYARANQRQPSYKKIITQIAAAGGDADAHAALAGAVLGAYLGYSRLPADWIAQMPHANWLNGIADAFADSVKK